MVDILMHLLYSNPVLTLATQTMPHMAIMRWQLALCLSLKYCDYKPSHCYMQQMVFTHPFLQYLSPDAFYGRVFVNSTQISCEQRRQNCEWHVAISIFIGNSTAYCGRTGFWCCQCLRTRGDPLSLIVGRVLSTENRNTIKRPSLRCRYPFW